MVKSVIGEETQLKSLESLLFQSSTPSQIGLIIGKLNPNPTSDRAYIYSLIPTPPTDAGLQPCTLKSEHNKKASSKGGPPPSLLIDADWVAEHARQVSRMLVGGMSVVGVYLWAPEAPFKATSPAILAQTIRGIAQAAPRYDSEVDERLILHISYSPSRWACRNCTVASGSMRPCDFKMGKVIGSLQAYRCMYNFNIRLPVFHYGTSDSHMFTNVLRSGIARHAKELQSAKALIDGKLVTDDQQITSGGMHEVEFLLPFMRDAPAEACSSDEVAGLVVFSGAIWAAAYLGPKEPISQAIFDLKGDIITSLQSRLDIISDEAEDKVDLTSKASGEVTDETSAEKSIHQLILHKLRKPYCLSFPRRVLVPWLAGICICDYLQPFESFEDLKDRCKEMMSMEPPLESSAVFEPEIEAASVMAKSFWDVIDVNLASRQNQFPNAIASTKRDVIGQSNSSSFNLLAAILVLLTALLVGIAITLLRPVKSAH